MFDIEALPDLFRSFRSLRTLRCLEFESCVFPAAALIRLQRVISWHPQERGPIANIKFHGCDITIEDTRFLSWPLSTNWSMLQSLTLYSPSSIPAPSEGQANLLLALSLLPLEGRPRLTDLHYSVKNASDLWNVLGTRLPSFPSLQNLTIWIREAVLKSTMPAGFGEYPSVPTYTSSDSANASAGNNDPSTRKSLRSINVIYQLDPQRAPVNSVRDLPLDEQRSLRNAVPSIASCREEGVVMYVTK
ncbi:hypothetical protein PYCCODRAFT_1009643 [Trametes coccinea BRFM310]|uniref:Uncharacterized protein n=1 Tax=Trametes coccinea (strain BRFM310) TaxID=1353009 RepID=A0A1Y2IB81_TRAC3|nr:hypothetical protein PYCCODRAFT_1009643 [Trametes coccinea BRFM310]